MSWLNVRRGLCPRCGAALSLSGSQVDCSFCGCTAVVERRLRTVEPDPADPRPLRRLEWVDESTAVHCVGCGRPLDAGPDSSAPNFFHCPGCDTHNKVERRLRRLLSTPQQAGPDDPHTLKLIWKAVNHEVLAERVVAAQELLEWGHMNETLARHIPDVLRTIQQSDARLAYPLARVVGRLLCTESRFYHDCVLEAAGEVLFRLDGCPALLFEIGMGPGSGLKLLMDVAQWASDQGAMEVACTALWGGSQILQRHYEEHPVLREVLLYRLLYASGPVLVWTLRMVQSRQGVAMRYPVEMLLHFFDEATLENALIADELATCIGQPEASDAVEFESRLSRFEGLRTPAARRLALSILGPPPAGISMRLLRRTTDLLIPWLDQPEALKALGQIFDSPAGVPQAIHDLVRQRGDSLPEGLRRLYLKKVPQTPHLSPLEPLYWESSQAVEPFALLEEEWRAGLRRAVDFYEQQQGLADDYSRRVRSRTPLMAAATVDRARQCLDEGHDLNEQNEQGWTALMFACEAGRADLVALYLESGACSDFRDDQGRSAFSVAAGAGHLSILDLLPVSPGELQGAFRQALRDDQAQLLAWTLAHGADPDTLEEEGRTPLIQAVLADRLPLARQLLVAGAFPDHTDRWQRCALHYAAELGLSEHVQLLLEHRADPNRPDERDDTPLTLARRQGHHQVESALKLA